MSIIDKIEKNKISPRTVPWGVPNRIVDQLGDEPFTTTHCVLPF